MRAIDADELLKVTVKRNRIWNGITNSSGEGLEEIINSQPTIGIPDNPTNKDVMCAFFGKVTLDKCMCIDPEWWNAPYKADKE